MPESNPPLIYQLKIVLVGISPMIWRRIKISSDSTIADLHYFSRIQAYLGHKNIQHTVRYTELSPKRFQEFWID